MSKGAITKKSKPSQARPHSRAVRRAISPGIDTDKSLKDVQLPAASDERRPAILAMHRGAGVSKKAKRGRNLSSRARKRVERGQDKALAVAERTETKIRKSAGQARATQRRSKTWEEVNREGRDRKGMGDEGEREWVDEDEGEGVVELDEKMGEAPVEESVASQSLPAEEVDEDDGII